jgi:hypothetical protein
MKTTTLVATRRATKRAGRRSDWFNIALAGAMWIGVLGVIVLPVSGCTRPRTEAHGKKADVMAAYSVDGLEAKLPPEVSVLAVRAATEAELRSRGYSIVDSVGTTDRMMIKARGSGERRSETMTVTSCVVARATCIKVDNGWFGDEAVSRGLLDGVLVRLGR